MKSVEMLWNELEKWFNKNADLSLNLYEGAKEKDIQKVELKLGIKFPNDFRESLLLHNGQEPNEDPQGIWMPGCGPLLPLDGIVRQWQMDRSGSDQNFEGTCLNDYVLNQFMHPKRIPIAADPFGDGIITYLDFLPGPKGKEGQLITLVTECDFVLLDISFYNAFERYLQFLQTGKLYWSKEEETLMMKGVDGTGEQIAEAFALVKN